MSEDSQNQLAEINAKLDKLLRAFPGGDVEGHARYHATVIEDMAERRKLRQAVSEKTISGLIWAGVVGLGLAVYHEIRRVAGLP